MGETHLGSNLMPNTRARPCKPFIPVNSRPCGPGGPELEVEVGEGAEGLAADGGDLGLREGALQCGDDVRQKGPSGRHQGKGMKGVWCLKGRKSC